MFIIFLIPIESCAQILDTPLEKCNFTKVTSHQELLDYLNELANAGDLVSIDTIGRSVQGREIPVVHFSENDSNKIRVLVFCQQHGDQPSGKEAALLLIKKLDITQNIIFIIILIYM